MSDTPTQTERIRDIERRVDDHDGLISAILVELRGLNDRLDKWEKRGLLALIVYLAGSDNAPEIIKLLGGA